MSAALRRLFSQPGALASRLLDPRFLYMRGLMGLEQARVRRQLERLSAHHRGAVDDFREERHSRLTAILRYAERHSGYYRDIFRAASVDPRSGRNFTGLPLLDKGIIRRESARLTSDWLTGVPHFLMNTGGSTGEPLEFPAVGGFDPIHQDFFHRLIGCSPGEVAVACDGTKVPDELRAQNVYWVPKPIPSYGHFAFSSLYLTEETAPHYLRGLTLLKPALIRGYPSVIFELARHALRRDGQMAFSPKAIVLTSETALPHQIDAIERAFATRVYLQYGHSEACLFAYTVDQRQEYFCSPFYGYVEVVDEEGRPVEPGESGEVVATGFHTWAMPLIRYRTGDVAVFGGDEQGLVRLRSLTGRSQDIVIARDGRRVFVTALVFGCHYHAFANVRRWQIIQDRPGEVKFLIVRDAGYTDADTEEIRSNFDKIGGISSTFAYVEEIPLTPRGKSRLLVQNLHL